MPTRPTAALAVALLALTTAACSGGTPVPGPSASAVSPEPTTSPTEALLPDATASGGAVGELAPGFPSDLVSPPEGSEILVSAAEPDAATGLTAISLNLRSPLEADALVAAVRDQLSAAGFTESVTDPGSSGLAASSTFTRGDGSEELLTLGVLDRDGVRTLTLGGTVRL
ncbi:hypothetical protein [Cellulomonas triticagri]|uniref:Uncharacterized protein n=1 Tax=Cellulomonas triticagri TaxID=2483352 RepID=A0A3M2JFP8_9CELL|nr:hypothetical protein [Cellulomonas triticagri]RMI09825.1 hypothetical protein EBM89_08785 [Cellulomonas triticagri]